MKGLVGRVLKSRIVSIEMTLYGVTQSEWVSPDNLFISMRRVRLRFSFSSGLRSHHEWKPSGDDCATPNFALGWPVRMRPGAVQS